MPKSSPLYALEASPLFRLNSKNFLAGLFHETWTSLEALAQRTDNYVVYSIKEKEDKRRVIEWPKQELDRRHARLLSLLNRITTPDYLHSSVKGRSYITNAQAHATDQPIVKLDIKKFYPSCHGGHVFSCFSKVFEQANDAAGLLTKLCVYDNHIPTGSCLSQKLAYFSHKELFDSIAAWCASQELTFTLYVDDLTISGRKANKQTVKTIGEMIKKRGLEFHKEEYFSARATKTVTGVIIRDGEYFVPNKRQKKIYDQLIELRSIEGDETTYKLCEKLLGRLNAAGQIETRFKGWASAVKQDLKEARIRLRQRRPVPS